MQVPLDDIVVKKRFRKNMDDIASLADSMKRLGQISPIVLNNANVLIAGGRRLEAARSLGWRTINAVILDIAGDLAKREYEVEENVQRRDFTPEELAEAAREIHKLKNPGFFRRILNGLVRFFKWLFKIED
jgi:ParB family chromosome partitioning protein